MPCIILCTYPKKQDAEKVVRLLLDKELAACVNIISGVESHFRWNNQIQTGSEYLLLIKTTHNLYSKVEQIIQSNHAYECPEIIAVNIDHGFGPYLTWLENSTQQSTDF